MTKPTSKATKVECPTCQTSITWSEEFPDRPFCSERCKLIDLGEWAAESHKIPGSPNYDDVLSGDLDLMAENPNKHLH